MTFPQFRHLVPWRSPSRIVSVGYLHHIACQVVSNNIPTVTTVVGSSRIVHYSPARYIPGVARQHGTHWIANCVRNGISIPASLSHLSFDLCTETYMSSAVTEPIRNSAEYPAKDRTACHGCNGLGGCLACGRKSLRASSQKISSFRFIVSHRIMFHSLTSIILLRIL